MERGLFPLLTRFLTVLALVCATSCLPKGGDSGTGGARGPQGNGEGIVGRQASILNYENGRVRCDFTRKAAREYDVNCVAVVKTTNGTELEATKVAEGHEVAWQAAPTQLAGIAVRSTCSSTELAQACRIELPSDEEALLEFALNISKTAENLTRKASDTVRLPYALQTFGNVPQTSFYASRSTEPQPTNPTAPAGPRRWLGPATGNQAPETLLPPVPLGVQVPLIPAEYAYIGRPYSACSRGDRTYFSTGDSDMVFQTGGHIVYVADKDGVRLFAGTYSNLPQYPAPDHRLRVSFGRNVQVICAESGIYTVENDRVLYLADSGEVRFLAGRTDGKRPTRGDAEPFWCAMNGAILPDGNLVVPDRCDHVGWAYPISKVLVAGATTAAPTGQISTLFNLGTPFTATAVAKDGTIYAAKGETTAARGIMRAGPGELLTDYITQTELVDFIKANENNKTYSQHLLAVDSAGLLYFAGFNGSRIYRKKADGTMEVFAGAAWATGYQPTCKTDVADGIPGTQGVLSAITSISFRADGALDISDSRHCRVRRIGADGKITTVVKTKSVYNNDGLVGKKLSEAVFPRIISMAMTPNGKIYFVENYSTKIHVINAAGDELSSIDIPNAYAAFGQVDSWTKHISLAAGHGNELYVLVRQDSPRTGKQLRRLSPDGTWTTLGTLSGNLDDDYVSLSVGADGSLLLTLRVTMRNFSNVYSAIYRWNFDEGYPEEMYRRGIADMEHFAMDATALANGTIFYTGNAKDVVFKVNDYSDASVVAGQMTAEGFSGDGGDATAAKLYSPLSITADKAGVLYVSDSENGRIRTLTPKPGGGHIINTLFGGDTGKECSGNVSVQSGLTGGESTMQQALSRLCYYKGQDVAVQNTCDQPNGDIKVAFTQRYYELGSIVRIVRPCPAN